MSALSILFLFLFFAMLFITYIIVRRGWLDVMTASGLCAVVSVFTLLGFSLSRENEVSLLYAMVVAVAIGLIFTGAIVAMASFFRANEPEAMEKAYLSKNRPPSSE